MIFQADKGKATVIMNKDVYKSKVNDMLWDERTYEKLNKDPTASNQRKLIGILTRLKREEKIDKGQYRYLYPTSEVIPRMYCTPKIHKQGNSLRPIVDYCGSIGNNTSRSLADILGPLVGNTEYHVKNSKHLSDSLTSTMIEEDKTFASHDVVRYSRTHP